MENSTLLIIAIICISLVIYFYLDGFDRFFGSDNGSENFERISPRGTNIRKDGAGHMKTHGLGVNQGRSQMPAVRDSVYGTLPNNTPQSILGQNLYGYDKQPTSGDSRSDISNILNPESPGYVPPNNTLYALGGAYNRPRGASLQADAFTGNLATFNSSGQRDDAFAGNALDGQAALNRQNVRRDWNDGARDGVVGESTTDIAAREFAAQRGAADNSAVSTAQTDAITRELQQAAAGLPSSTEARMRPMPNVGNILN